jgi:hypothetical protein
MESIAKNDLRSRFLKVSRGHSFDGAVGTDRHKNWGLNFAMGEA